MQAREASTLRVIVANDSDEAAQQVRNILASHGVECPSGHVVPVEAAADRASRVAPDLVVLNLCPNTETGIQTLAEVGKILPDAVVLAVGPAIDPKLILRALHEGAAEYLDEAQLDAELAGALVRMKAKKASPRTRGTAGRVISILAASGGSGSSTLAANISVALAGRGGECGLIDLRLAAGDLASMLDLKPRHSLAHLCDYLARLDQSLFEQLLVRHRSGVHLLAAPRELEGARRVTGKGVRRALAMARVRFPYVVVDVDGSFGDEQVEAIWQSDVIVLVLRLDFTSVRNTRRVMDTFVQLGIGLERVRLVVNGYGQRKQLSVRQAEEALGMRIEHSIPHDPATVNRAINRGTPVVSYRPSKQVSVTIRDLAASVNGCAGRVAGQTEQTPSAL
jgi:pilus assembly protein CpaE